MIFRIAVSFCLYLFVSQFLAIHHIPCALSNASADELLCKVPWAPPECFEESPGIPPSEDVITPEEANDTSEEKNSGTTNFFVTYDFQARVLKLLNNMASAPVFMWVITPEQRLSYFDSSTGSWGNMLDIFNLDEGLYEYSPPSINGLNRALAFGKYRFSVNLAGETKFTTISIPDDMRSISPMNRIISANHAGIAYITPLTLIKTMARWNSSWDDGINVNGCTYVPLGITAPGITVRYLAEDTARIYFSTGVKCSDRGQWVKKGDEWQYIQPLPAPPPLVDGKACYGPDCRNSLMLKIVPYESVTDELENSLPSQIEFPKEYAVYKEYLIDYSPDGNEFGYYKNYFYVLSNHLDIALSELTEDSFLYNILISSPAATGSGLGPWNVNFPPLSGVEKTFDPSLAESRIEITENGRIRNRLHLVTQIERRNNYNGSFHGYLLLDKDNDNIYEDIRYVPVENDTVNATFDFLAEDFPNHDFYQPEPTGTNATDVDDQGLTSDQTFMYQGDQKVWLSQAVNFSLEILDDNHMLVAGAGTGMSFNTYIPKPTSTPVGLAVEASMNENSELVINYQIAWGSRGVYEPIPVYLALQPRREKGDIWPNPFIDPLVEPPIVINERDFGAIYLVGERGEIASTQRFPLYIINAGAEAGIKNGSITARIDRDGFWSFLYKGSYTVFLFYHDGKRLVGTQTAVNVE